MMTSERSVDGIAKLLSKADSEKLRAPGKREAVNKAEYLGFESSMFFQVMRRVLFLLFFPEEDSVKQTAGNFWKMLGMCM